MKLKTLSAAAAVAAAVAVTGCANWGGSGAAGGGTSAVPRGSQAYPTGSTATPSGHSPRQGAGIHGSATADFHALDSNRVAP